MLHIDQDVRALGDFGLTPNQAKVYLATVQLGLASISRISKMSRVRREDVYRMLPRLEELGLVEKIMGTPVKIRAVPLEDALSALIKREQDAASRKITALTAKREGLLKNFKANLKKLTMEEEKGQFSLLSRRDLIINKGLKMMRDAKKEIDLTTSRQRLLELIPAHGETIEKAIRRGVEVRINVQAWEPGDSIQKLFGRYSASMQSIKLRFSEYPSSYYLIADHTQALVSTSTEGSFAESPYLWTDNKSLVETMQENFEESWHSSVDAETLQTNAIPEKLTHFVEQLKPTDHIIFVYQTQEAKHNVLFQYLKNGLERGEAAVYVASEESPDQVRNAMKEFGMDVERYEKKRALQVFGYNEAYIINGKPDIKATMKFWTKLYGQARENGFNGFRVTGEMACFFKHHFITELVDYERSLHRILEIPMIAICAYNAENLGEAHNPINLYNELARAHSTILFAGIDNKLGKIEIRRA